MKAARSHFLLLGCLLSGVSGAHAQEDKKEAPPVEFPKLEKFELLWKHSIFTTKDLPAPEDPGAPNFAGNLGLSGLYEIDGGVVAVLVDRTTSQVMEARIGSENEMGIKIRQVTPGASVDKTRIQLQKGDKTGWVSFGEADASPPAEVVRPAVIPTRTTEAPPRTLRSSPPNPILPPPPASTPSPNLVNDVPLPPP